MTITGLDRQAKEVRGTAGGVAVSPGRCLKCLSAPQGEAAACAVGNLRAGCRYHVRVRARNAAGFSPASCPAEVRTSPDAPEAPPGPPRATARAQDGFSVAWDPPDHDGGAPITSYRLESCRGAHLERTMLWPAETHASFPWC